MSDLATEIANRKIFKLGTERFNEFVLYRSKHNSRCFGTTNGCFDLIHCGHIISLLEASKRVAFLVVGLNSDASVRRLKGDNRPIVEERYRALALAALPFVSAVCIFEEDDPRCFIEAVRPMYHFKGGDYEIDDLVEKDLILNMGARFMCLPMVDGISSSAIEKKIIDDWR